MTPVFAFFVAFIPESSYDYHGICNPRLVVRYRWILPRISQLSIFCILFLPSDTFDGARFFFEVLRFFASTIVVYFSAAFDCVYFLYYVFYFRLKIHQNPSLYLLYLLSSYASHYKMFEINSKDENVCVVEERLIIRYSLIFVWICALMDGHTVSVLIRPTSVSLFYILDFVS